MKIIILNRDLIESLPMYNNWKSIPNSGDKFRLDFLDESNFRLQLKSLTPFFIPDFTLAYIKCTVVKYETNKAYVQARFVLPIINIAIIVFSCAGWASKTLLTKEAIEWHRVFFFFVIIMAIAIHLKRTKDKLYKELENLQVF